MGYSPWGHKESDMTKHIARMGGEHKDCKEKEIL